MLKACSLFVFISLIGAICYAQDTWVNGYYRSDGTYVQGHYRSSPNAYRWDNKSYTPSQPAYNDSYYKPKKNYNSNWYQPSDTRYQDNNPYNDNPPSMYKQKKSKSNWNYFD